MTTFEDLINDIVDDAVTTAVDNLDTPDIESDAREAGAEAGSDAGSEAASDYLSGNLAECVASELQDFDFDDLFASRFMDTDVDKFTTQVIERVKQKLKGECAIPATRGDLRTFVSGVVTVELACIRVALRAATARVTDLEGRLNQLNEQNSGTRAEPQSMPF